MVIVFNVIFEFFYYFGYIFLLIVCFGGIKEWSGYIEGSIDLMKLVGFVFCVVFCELINDDGIMVCLFEIIKFGLEYKYLVVIINDLKEY